MKLIFMFMMVLSLPAFAVDIIPTPKPSMPTSAEFQSIIDRAVDDIQSITTITPPPLPDQKKPLVAIAKGAFDALPYPMRKPLHLKQTVTSTTLPDNPKDRVIIEYRNDSGGDNRMAGDRAPTRERIYAERRTKLKETSEKSPFKTAQLPRAKKVISTSDPVILFFKENASDMEVGQIDILKSDVLKPLKRQKSKKVIIYGYAERNTKTPDRTNQLALSRALMISDYLVDNRIADTRLQIRPMGADTPISPKDRVDIVIYN